MYVQEFPATPTVDDAPEEVLTSGHCWLLEHVAGAPLRFQVQESGLIRFGDRDRVVGDPDALPEPYRCAVRHVRERLDRDALREAVADVEGVVFYGVATVHDGIDYDWQRLPPFLGYDVWSADAGASGAADEGGAGDGEDGDDTGAGGGAFLQPDAVAAIYERLGLEPATAIERELPLRDFDPESYAFPQSAWYDGPVAGVLVRNKRGGRALLRNEAVEADARPAIETSSDGDASAEALATAFATPAQLERVADDLDDRGQPVTDDALAEQSFEAVAREARHALYGGDATVDPDVVRAEVGARARAFLAERPDGAW